MEGLLRSNTGNCSGREIPCRPARGDDKSVFQSRDDRPGGAMKMNRSGFKIRIQHRLTAGFFAGAMLVVSILFQNNRSTLAGTEQLHETVSIQIRIMIRANQLQYRANRIRFLESGLERPSDFSAATGTLAELERSIADFEEELVKFVSDLLPRDSGESTRLLNAWRAYVDDLWRSMRAARAMERKEPAGISTLSSGPRFLAFSSLLEQISTGTGEKVGERFRRSIAELNSIHRTFMLMALIGIGFGVICIIFLCGALSRRIRRLGDAAMLMAEGRLDNPVPVRGQDEIAELAAVFEIMQERVKRREEDLLKAKEDAQMLVAMRTIELEEQAAKLIRAREDAEIAGRARSAFFTNRSNELRTPLNAILGHARSLRQEPGFDKSRRSGVDIILRSSTLLLTLIGDILDLSKIEAGCLDLKPSAVHLGNFLNNIEGMIRIRAEDKGLCLKSEFAGDLPVDVTVDERRLRQVLINLLGNAVKFSCEGGIVFRVSLAHDDPVHAGGCKLLFEVEDTGVGISGRYLNSIFHPLEQAGDSLEQDRGAGLGLAISQRLMQKMGSTIRTTSRPGKGSTFWFELWMPVVEAEPDVIREEPGGGEETGSSGSRIEP